MLNPKHIAVITKGATEWGRKRGKSKPNSYRKRLTNILKFVDFQVSKKIPIMTYHLLSTNVRDTEDYLPYVDALVDFFNKLISDKKIQENKIKISILGKWYNLPGHLVEMIKKTIEDTKDYDDYFMNLCINYDGQEEIVDACKLIGRKIKLTRLDVDSITKEDIKNDLYSSYFMPPDLIFVAGNEKKLNSFLLWDSVDAIIYFSNKLWPEVDEKEMMKAINYWEKHK